VPLLACAAVPVCGQAINRALGSAPVASSAEKRQLRLPSTFQQPHWRRTRPGALCSAGTAVQARTAVHASSGTELLNLWAGKLAGSSPEADPTKFSAYNQMHRRCTSKQKRQIGLRRLLAGGNNRSTEIAKHLCVSAAEQVVCIPNGYLPTGTMLTAGRDAAFSVQKHIVLPSAKHIGLTARR
jgi:hypothetical protein